MENIHLQLRILIKNYYSNVTVLLTAYRFFGKILRTKKHFYIQSYLQNKKSFQGDEREKQRKRERKKKLLQKFSFQTKTQQNLFIFLYLFYWMEDLLKMRDIFGLFFVFSQIVVDDARKGFELSQKFIKALKKHHYEKI